MSSKISALVKKIDESKYSLIEVRSNSGSEEIRILADGNQFNFKSPEEIKLFITQNQAYTELSPMLSELEIKFL